MRNSRINSTFADNTRSRSRNMPAGSDIDERTVTEQRFRTPKRRGGDLQHEETMRLSGEVTADADQSNVAAAVSTAQRLEFRAPNPVPTPVPVPTATNDFGALVQAIRDLQSTFLTQSVATADAVLQTLARVGGGNAADGRETISRSNVGAPRPNAQTNPTRAQPERRRERSREESLSDEFSDRKERFNRSPCKRRNTRVPAPTEAANVLTQSSVSRRAAAQNEFATSGIVSTPRGRAPSVTSSRRADCSPNRSNCGETRTEVDWTDADREPLVKSNSRQRDTEASGAKIRSFLADTELYLSLCKRPGEKWGYFVLSWLGTEEAEKVRSAHLADNLSDYATFCEGQLTLFAKSSLQERSAHNFKR